MTLNELLGSMDLAQYQTVFADNDLVDLTDCQSLTSNELEDLGITSLGHRKKLLAAFAATVDAAEVAPPVVQQPESPPAPAVTTTPNLAAPIPAPVAPKPMKQGENIQAFRVASYLLDWVFVVLIRNGLIELGDIFFSFTIPIDYLLVGAAYFLGAALLPMGSPAQMVLSLRCEPAAEGASLRVARLRHYLVVFVPVIVAPYILGTLATQAEEKVLELTAIVDAEVRGNTTTETRTIKGFFTDDVVEKQIVPTRNKQASHSLLMQAKASHDRRHSMFKACVLGTWAYNIFLLIFFVSQRTPAVQDKFSGLQYRVQRET